jgi:acyl-CoA thioesterase-1
MFAKKTANMLCFCAIVTLATGFSAIKAEPMRIIFLGDSLTAGYGIDPDQAYPTLIEQKIRARGSNAEVINAGLSGDTSAGGLRRLNWLLRRPMDVLVLALGANDALRGFDLNTTRNNLEAIIQAVREKYPECKIIIAGMKAPPNMGGSYGQTFEAIFTDLAEKHQLPLIEFILEGVAGHPEKNLEDGIHPNPTGQKILAQNVWEVLEAGF